MSERAFPDLIAFFKLIITMSCLCPRSCPVLLLIGLWGILKWQWVYWSFLSAYFNLNCLYLSMFLTSALSNSYCEVWWLNHHPYIYIKRCPKKRWSILNRPQEESAIWIKISKFWGTLFLILASRKQWNKWLANTSNISWIESQYPI